MYVDNPKENSFVVEVKAMEVTSPDKTIHSCGMYDEKLHSLRIPTFERFRDDKRTSDVTTTQMLHEL